MPRNPEQPAAKTVEALRHEEAKRRNIPTAAYQSVLAKAAQDPGVPGRAAADRAACG